MNDHDQADPRRRVARYRALLASERDSAALYRRLADASRGERRQVLLELAEVEESHAEHWAQRLRELGEPVPSASEHRPSRRTRLLGWLARRFSVSAVLPIVERAERADAGMYDDEPAAASNMPIDERAHARVLARLAPDGGGRSVGRGERWHRGDRSGSLRAAVFGVNDGLVSNAALVMGFAGSGAASRTILFAGVAGWLAGAFSMAAGEYISMVSQREIYEREIRLEKLELQEMPEEEYEELVLIYRAKGLPEDEARQLAGRIMKDEDIALDTMAREELGLDPEELGSPWGAAISSFLAFSAGAIVVVLPYLVGSGTAAFVTAIALAALSLVTVGASIGALAGRSPWWSAGRQLLVGVLAAGATYFIGSAIGLTTG